MCVDHEAELGSMGDSWKPFHRWLDVWSYPLQAWGLLFANLAGHSPDYLATHWFVDDAISFPTSMPRSLCDFVACLCMLRFGKSQRSTRS